MQAEIISNGDEITSGRILDTNAQWLSQRLEDLGVRVLYHTAVGDELDAMVDVFRLAMRRADVVVVTGGLGPTADDLARQALARAADRSLVLDPVALDHVRSIFARRRRPMPQQNEVQGYMPQGSRIIHNPNGTAPGIAMHVPRPGASDCWFYCLPGVPAEMKDMWPQVEQLLREAGAGRQIIVHRAIKCFGAGESQIEAMLPDMIRRGRLPRVGITASQTTIILRVTAEGATREDCLKAMEPTVSTIYDCLGTLVFGEGDDELQDVAARLLRERRQTLATAEAGTAGMLADWLAAADPSGDCYRGGTVSASADSTARLLDVSQPLLDEHGMQSSQAVEAMAQGCRKRLQADYGLAVGPFPSPNQDQPQPVFLALATPEGMKTKTVPFAGHPATLRILCAKHALNLLRLAMVGVLFAIFFCGRALTAAHAADAAAEERSQLAWVQTGVLPAPEAYQATAADKQFVYAIANAQIAKYDRATGERVATSTGEAKHPNSGFLWEGRFYCAHSNFPHMPERSEIKRTIRLPAVCWASTEPSDWWSSRSRSRSRQPRRPAIGRRSPKNRNKTLASHSFYV